MANRKETVPGKLRLAILVNTIAPYRVPIYAQLANHFNTLVLHGGTEANRHWEAEAPPSFRSERVPSLQLRLRKQTGFRRISDTSYVHLNFGLAWALPRFRPDAIVSNELGMRTLLA